MDFSGRFEPGLLVAGFKQEPVHVVIIQERRQRAAGERKRQPNRQLARRDLGIPSTLGAGLVREAAQRALADAHMTWTDIDAVVIGKAPDAFEGIVQPELFLADALGGAGKPMLRVHTAGSVGGSTFIVECRDDTCAQCGEINMLRTRRDDEPRLR